MGKLNEIQEQTTQSYGSNSFTTRIKENTVEFDSAKDKFTFLDPIEVPSINVGGTASVPFTSEDRTKLDNLQTPMQIKGRVDSVGDLPTEGVKVGDTYLVGLSGSEAFDEYVCVELSGSPEAPTWESVGTTQVQSDWNQTETSASDYIKNRPFGLVKSTELIASFTINNYAPLPFTVSTDLIAGLTYKVVVAETEYELVCQGQQGALNYIVLPTGGNLYYDPEHTTVQNQYNAFYTGSKTDQQVQIYCYIKLVKISDDYLNGKLIRKGGAQYAEIFNTHSNTATGKYSHSEGFLTTASGEASHSEGKSTTASGDYSHSEGNSTTASGKRAHSEGSNTTASGDYSHSEGNSTTASGKYSHSEGSNTTASGDYSHSSGYQTTANHKSQFAFGEYNALDPSAAAATARGTYVEIVGNGTSSSARSNARTLDWDGNEVLSGTLTAIAGVSTKKLTISSIDPTDVFMHSEIMDASSDVAFSRVVANASSSKTDGYVEILYKASSGVTCSAYIDSADVTLTADGAWHKLEQGCDPADGVEIHINNPSPVTDATLEVISKVYYI